MQLEIAIETTASVEKVLDVVEAEIVAQWGPHSPTRFGSAEVHAAKIRRPSTRRLLVVLGLVNLPVLLASMWRWSNQRPKTEARFMVKNDWNGVIITTEGRNTGMQYDILLGTLDRLLAAGAITAFEHQAHRDRLHAQ